TMRAATQQLRHRHADGHANVPTRPVVRLTHVDTHPPANQHCHQHVQQNPNRPTDQHQHPHLHADAHADHYHHTHGVPHRHLCKPRPLHSHHRGRYSHDHRRHSENR